MDNIMDPCPKCGYESPGEDICEACGVLISKVRGRRRLDKDDDDDIVVIPGVSIEEPQRLSLTKLVLMIVIVAAVLGLAFNSMRKAGVFGEELAGTPVFSTFSETFESDVLAHSASPVMVDFYATWCGTCKVLAPELDTLAKDMAGKLKIMKVDVDDNADLAQRYGVQILPTVILFRNGKEVERFIGSLPAAQLKAVVERNS